MSWWKTNLESRERLVGELDRALHQPQPEPVASLMTHVQSGDMEVVWNDDGFDREMWHETPLYAAPPQPEAAAEPVAWRTKNATPPGGYVVFQQYPSAVADLGGEIEPLYTAPPHQEPRLRYDILHEYADLHKLNYNDLCRVVRDSLTKEKTND